MDLCPKFSAPLVGACCLLGRLADRPCAAPRRLPWPRVHRPLSLRLGHVDVRGSSARLSLVNRPLGLSRGHGFLLFQPPPRLDGFPLLPLLGIEWTWNGLLIGNRVAGVGVAFWCARGWGLHRGGALVAAAVYGCSPFFHGYAVEGIAEGQLSWALPLWLGWVGRGQHRWAGLGFALTVLGSWYMAASACLIAVVIPRQSWRSVLTGLVLASPAVYAFLGAFPERELLDPHVRAAMGSQMGAWEPGIASGLNPFAKTSWIGFGVAALVLLQARHTPRLLVAAVGLWWLSMGQPLTADLPLFGSLRFPYRLHAATLVLLAYIAGQCADRFERGTLFAFVIAAEALLLSPIEPLLPRAESTQPGVYRGIEGTTLLDIPGPIAMAPGIHNPSRPRARHFLYGQLAHGMGTPWAPDFNSIGTSAEEPSYLESVRGYDPHWPLHTDEALSIPEQIDFVVIHPQELGSRVRSLREALNSSGWVLDLRDTEGRERYSR